MDIFNIPQPQYKDLAAMEKDLDFLDRIWGLKDEWEQLYYGWKDGSFTDIKARAAFRGRTGFGRAWAGLGWERCCVG